MKSKIFYIAASGLNSGVVQEVDVRLYVDNYVIDGQQYVEDAYYYPLEIAIINDSNSDVEFIVLSEEREEKLYTNKPEYFDFIPLENYSRYVSSEQAKTYKVLIRKTNSIAAYPIQIRCIGYRK